MRGFWDDFLFFGSTIFWNTFQPIPYSPCFFFFFWTGPAFLKIEPIGLAIVVGIGIGIVCSGLVSVYERWCVPTNVDDVMHQRKDVEEGDALKNNGSDNGSGGDVQLGEPKKNENSAVVDEEEKEEIPLNNDNNDNHNNDDDDDEDLMTLKATQREGAEKPFVPLLILSALVVAFAHGGNDVGNAVGPLAVIVEAVNQGTVAGTPNIPMWALVIGGKKHGGLDLYILNR